jgi:hypothetical protein
MKPMITRFVTASMTPPCVNLLGLSAKSKTQPPCQRKIPGCHNRVLRERSSSASVGIYG